MNATPVNCIIWVDFNSFQVILPCCQDSFSSICKIPVSRNLTQCQLKKQILINWQNDKWQRLFVSISLLRGGTTVFRVRATPWSPWKALEFNFGLQGHLKSPWKKGFYGKLLENSLNFILGENCRDCIMLSEKRHFKNWAQNWLLGKH